MWMDLQALGGLQTFLFSLSLIGGDFLSC